MKKTEKLLFKKQEGQSTIEFLISFTIIFGMTFFIVTTTMNYGNGFYLHWATYAASRVYLTYETNDNNGLAGVFGGARTQATNLFNAYGINGATIEFNDDNSAGRNVLIGAYAEFESKFSPMSNIGNNEKVKFRSESFLGREPPRGYCFEMIRERIDDATGGGPITKFMTVFDNGC